MDSLCKTVLNPIKGIRGIVFDLDDTLYPQISYKRSGFKVVSNWVASQFNLEPFSVLSELEHILTQRGPSYPHMFDRLAERLKINAGFVSEMVRVFIEHEPQIRCYDGVIPVLSRLRRNYRLGILTDGRFTVQQKKIRALELAQQVDEILYSDIMGLEKPALELFQWFEEKLLMTGERLLYVGDNPKKDFYGANIRRWCTICVMTGENRDSGLNKWFKSQYSIPSIIDLEKFLRSHR